MLIRHALEAGKSLFILFQGFLVRSCPCKFEPVVHQKIGLVRCFNDGFFQQLQVTLFFLFFIHLLFRVAEVIDQRLPKPTIKIPATTEYLHATEYFLMNTAHKKQSGRIAKEAGHIIVPCFMDTLVHKRQSISHDTLRLNLFFKRLDTFPIQGFISIQDEQPIPSGMFE